MFKKMSEAIRLKTLLGLVLLFLLTLCISIVYHLPVSWLLGQPSIQKHIPSQITLSPSHGTVWEGKSYLSVPEPLGSLQWNLSFWSLLIGEVKLDSFWKKEQSQLQGQIQVDGGSEPQTLELTQLNGQIALPLLLKVINAPGLKEMPIKGELAFDSIDLVLDVNTQWPTALTGEWTLNELTVLGNDFPEITITPQLQGEKLTLHIDGKSTHWVLSGELNVFQNQQYNIHLKVTANSENSLPDWAGLLRKQGDKVAVLNHRGVW